MKPMNKTDLQIMKYLWKIDRGFMKDIVEQFPSPSPAYTTISTLVGRMVDKGYIGFEKTGRDKLYFPAIRKNDYFTWQLKDMVSNFFNNSSSQFASFYTRNADFTIEELEELQALVEKRLSQKKQK